MATSSDSVKSQDYVDFDEYIDIQLRKTGSTIKTTDVLTAVVGILTLVTLYLLVFVICDHWLVPGGFGPVSRGIMLALVVGAAGAWLVLKVVWPWRRRVSGLYAASTIEKASPALKSSLLNLVDLSRSGYEVRPEIYESIERRAALALSHVDVNEAVDRRSLLRLSNVLLAVVVLFCLYWIFSPKNPATSLWRAMIPAADVGVATRTEIFNVRPGDKDVLARSQLEVTADLRGEIPAQTFLYFTTADHKFVDERIEMRLENESSKRFRCVMTGDNGAGLLQNMTYRIVAGDAATPEYKIRVIQPPTATIESIRLEYPEYTRRESVIQAAGAIDALEGTKVTLKARANMPLRSPASLQFFDDETASKRAEEIPIRVTDGTKLQVEWKLEIRSDGTYPHYYRIFCTNEAGESDPSPSLYSLAIRPDQPPEIILRDPKTDLELPANAVLPLVIEARDPDFTLRYVDLNIEKDGSPINGPTIYDGHDQQFKTTYKWSLRDYHLRPKETVTYWLQSKDNRQPIANTSTTPKLRIRIVDPVPEDQVKKNLEMAQKRQKEEFDKSEAARSAQEKPDDEQAAADAKEKQQKQANRPKGKARQQQPEQPQRARQNEKADNQNDQTQNGEGEQQGKGDQGQSQDGQKDKNSAADGQNKKQELNPDDSADDSKVLQKLLDKQQPDEDKENNSQSKGQGSQGADDQGKTDKNAASPDQKEKQKSGSSPDSAQSGKPSENKSAEAAQKEKQSQSTGSKSGEQQNGEEKNQSQPQKDAKEQSSNSGEKKLESIGSKPQGEKSPDSNKGGDKSGAEQKSKAAEQKGSENGAQKGTEKGEQKGAEKGEKGSKHDSANRSPESKDRQDKTGDRQDNKSSGDHKTDSAAQDQNRNSDSQKDAGSKEDQSRNDSSKSGRQPDRTPDAKQQPGAQGGSKDADKDQNGAQKKSETQPQNGNEAGGEKRNDQSDKQGAAQNQTRAKDAQQSSSPKNGEEATPNQTTKKEPGAKDAGEKQAGEKQAQRGDAAQKGSQKPDAARKDEPNQKPRPDASKVDGKNSDPDKAEKTNVAPPDGAKGQKARPDDRRPKKNLDEELPPTNPKATGERPNATPDKKNLSPPGGRESDVGPEADKQQSAAPKDATSEQASQKSAEQKSGAQKAGAQQKAGDQQGADGQKKADASKSDGQKAGGEKESAQKAGGQQASDKKSAGDQGAGSKGEGQGKGQGQQGQGQGGKEGAQGTSRTAGTKGGKQGAGNGKAQDGNSGGGFNNGSSNGPGEGLVDTTKEANLDYAKKATDLVLRRLDDQLKRGEVDEKVQEELGWTKDQIRRFVERMKKQAQAADEPNSPAAEARRLQFEETLKSLNLRSPAKSRSSQAVPKSNDAEMESKRSIPPPEYRDLYNAFTKSLARPAPPPADDKK
jgi:hypothetical protein